MSFRDREMKLDTGEERRRRRRRMRRKKREREKERRRERERKKERKKRESRLSVLLIVRVKCPSRKGNSARLYKVA